MIAKGLHIGLSKREMMHDYTMRELLLVLDEHGNIAKEAAEPKADVVSAEDF